MALPAVLMTVCLIIPPSIFLLDERVFMTLGILKVAAVLEQGGIEVQMLDLSGIENYEDVVRDHAAAPDAKGVGLTATPPQTPSAPYPPCPTSSSRATGKRPSSSRSPTTPRASSTRTIRNPTSFSPT